MDEIGPRGSEKLLWQLSRAFFRCACPNNIVFVDWIACQGAFWARWRFLALPGGSSRLAGCLCVPLGAPGCPWRPLAAPGPPCCPLAAPGGPWRLLAAPGVPWRPLAAPGASWRPLAAPGASWRLLAAGWLPLCAPGCPWVPLLPPGGPWRPLAAPGGPRCPLALPGGSWRLLAPPGCPWRLLAVPGDHWLAPVPGDFLAGPQHSHSRCDSQVFSLIQARGWRSKFAFSLRFPSVFCDSSVWLALKIRILAAIPKCFL